MRPIEWHSFPAITTTAAMFPIIPCTSAANAAAAAAEGGRFGCILAVARSS